MDPDLNPDPFCCVSDPDVIESGSRPFAESASAARICCIRTQINKQFLLSQDQVKVLYEKA